MAKFNFTLLLYVSLVLAFAASSNASNFGPHRRDHADLGRLLKKRAPIDILGSQPSAQTPSTSPAAQSTQATPSSAQTTPVNSVSVQTTSEAASASASAVSSTLKTHGI
ncbi:hypothetical protein J3R83DRAFT_6428 [Lanmaoa asiatica]|nr:hypothetical protein J3R83DRAFT_6428 [Lanmaoa asiatica]